MPSTRAVSTPMPWAAVLAAVLALPTACVLVVVGWGALLFANERADGAVWFVLVIAIGWLAGLLAGAIRLLLGRSWASLAGTAGAVAVLMVFGLLRGGLGSGPFGFGPMAALVSVATTVLAALPAVRRWVAVQRRERLYPGSTRPAGSTAGERTDRSRRG